MALAEQGFAAQVALWPQGELSPHINNWGNQANLQRPIARISLAQGGPKDPLYAHILNRHTPKTDYDTARIVSSTSVEKLVASVKPGGIVVAAAGTVDVGKLPALRMLCEQSAIVEISTLRTMMESIKLLRVGSEEILANRDGIPITSPLVVAMSKAGIFDRSAAPASGSTGYKRALSRFEGHSRTSMGFVWLSTPGNEAVKKPDFRARHFGCRCFADQFS